MQSNPDLSHNRTDQLTFVRFLAALSVVFFHNYHPLSLFNHTNLAVGFFFILSGFVLGVSQKPDAAGRIGVRGFYLRRLARIYPLYIVSMLAMIPMVQQRGHPESLTGIMLCVFMVQSFVPGYGGALNYPAWSISNEMFFYLLFPLLLCFLHRYKRTALAALLCYWVLVQAFSIAVYAGPPGPVFSQSMRDYLLFAPFLHLNQFGLGLVLAAVYRSGRLRPRNYDLVLTGIAVATALYLQFFRQRYEVSDHFGLMALLFAPAILLLALNTGRLSRLFRWPFLVLLGEASYCLYIIAEPFLYHLSRLGAAVHLPQLGSFLVALPLLLLAAVSLHLGFERPLQRLIVRKWAQS